MTLYSKWGEILNIDSPLQEYPRPNLIRDSYVNLNGVWEYQIINDGESISNDWNKIIVPFGVGSKLSTVSNILQPTQELWYRKRFDYNKKNKKTILHFEAVDQVCWVYLNGVYVGEHEGGYDKFSFDVSDIIKASNELIVKVKDYSEKGIYSYGKQRLKPNGIWYTPISGIWQTVWLEDVSLDYIEDVFYQCDFDNKKLTVSLVGNFKQAVIVISEKGKIIKRDITSDNIVEIEFEEIHPWSIEDPFLYDVYIETEGDTIKSYFGMRKVSRIIDEKGIARFALNNKALFLSGVLDQGYTCDGIYTYPSDEAMIFDISMAKKLGFNMIRKHLKQENRRFYYLCDRMGILVFQDMINGGGASNLISYKQIIGMLGFKKDDSKYKFFKRDDENGRKMYYKELNDMILTLYNNPSIVCWTLFNEGWGQFDSREVINFVNKIDDSRLINHASGFFDQGLQDFYCRHIYFKKINFKKDKFNRINIIGEFGGYSYFVKGHSQFDKGYGYKNFKNVEMFNKKLIDVYRNEIYPCIKEGLSGCVLTQLYDVEKECNGLITYDRKVLKVDAKRIAAINLKLTKGVK